MLGGDIRPLCLRAIGAAVAGVNCVSSTLHVAWPELFRYVYSENNKIADENGKQINDYDNGIFYGIACQYWSEVALKA